jgi:serpin B
MGVNKAFDQDQADLSGIAGKKGDLIIDKIAQKTFIDVAEQGVEAAAADYYCKRLYEFSNVKLKLCL